MKLKKISIAFAIMLILAMPAFAENSSVQTQYNPVLTENANEIGSIPQPYENICKTLSNGKEAVFKNISSAVAENLNAPEFKILENIGVATAKQYAGDPVLGMTKFCGCLDEFTTLNAQVKAATAFAKGYKKAGVFIIPVGTIDETPKTKQAIVTGKLAYFIPFASGTNFKVSIFGKKGQTAKIWKILGDKPTSKEWGGGFWEREITVTGK